MKKIIGFDQAVRVILFMVWALILFHASILIGILGFDYAPIDLLWGGKMQTSQQLLNFEIASLAVVVLILLLVLIRAKKVNLSKLIGFSKIAMWFLFVMFMLNTVGNIIAPSNFERAFAIVTAALSILFLRLAIEKSEG